MGLFSTSNRAAKKTLNNSANLIQLTWGEWGDPGSRRLETERFSGRGTGKLGFEGYVGVY